MIINSVRLKNIKSFGEGINGDGVTIGFQRGVNRIAGRNGHGKTTIIEAIGYALFLSEPIYEDNFQVHTYLLNNKASSGEIDVTFTINNEVYRIERGVSRNNKRRTKVIQVSDESICAEDDAEVKTFLFNLLKLPNVDMLGEVFDKLVGIKQGHLTLPFDTKRSVAKSYFDPLFDVEIFRQCFEDLLPVEKRFETLKGDSKVRMASVGQMVNNNSDSADNLQKLELAIVETTGQKKSAEEAENAARENCSRFDKLEKALQSAESAKEKSIAADEKANALHILAQKSLADSENAFSILSANSAEYSICKEAEQSIKQQEKLRTDRDALRKKYQDAEKEKFDFDKKAEKVKIQIDSYSEQIDKIKSDKEQLEKDSSVIKTQIDSTKDEFECEQLFARELSEVQYVLKNWCSGLDDSIKTIEEQSKELLSVEAITVACKLEKDCPVKIKYLGSEIEKFYSLCNEIYPERVKKAVNSLSNVLDSTISFDSAKKPIADMLKYICDFVKGALIWWGKADIVLKSRLHEADAKKTLRALNEERLSKFCTEISKALKETANLAKMKEECENNREAFETASIKLIDSLNDYENQLKPFADIESELLKLQSVRDKTKSSYELYLQHKPLADELQIRKETLQRSLDQVDIAKSAKKVAEEQYSLAVSAYNAKLHTEAKEDLELKLKKSSELKITLANLSENQTKEKIRFKAWENASKELRALDAEAVRYQAAIELTHLSRTVLQKTAPAVAHHLCRRVAKEAQSIFNMIHQEAIMLKWESDGYGLQITPGERRFAMLSGGEQTKLALAITLAMIQVFSNLKFCIFDEPTYGVDADSRSKLAEAILNAHEAAKLEQLILVTHDDAFDGIVENTLTLQKSAAGGSVVV